VTEAELETTRHGGDDVARELHALGAQVAALQAEMRRIQGAALPHDAGAGWDDEPAASYTWLAALDTRRSSVRIPRLPFELAFIAAAAVLAGVAHLRPVTIAAVMGGAWAVVALAEWAGSQGDRMRNRLLLASPAPAAAPERVAADPSWFSPPVEHTMLTHGRTAEAGEGAKEQDKVVTRLPRAQDPETTIVPPASRSG